MALNYLIRALEAKKKEKRASYYVYDDDSFFSSTWIEISQALESWPFHTTDLSNPKYWRTENLEQPDGSYRKPIIRTLVELTSKGNLALNWYPHLPVYRLGESDWMYWDDGWPAGSVSLPFNRIIMIRGFEFYIYHYRRKKYTRADEYLVRAVHRLLKDVYFFLGHIVEVIREEDLYLEFEENKRPMINRRLIACHIRKVQEVQKEIQAKQQQEWLNQTFDERLGISPTDFLHVYREAERRPTTTAKLLLKELNVSLSYSTAKRYAEKLYHEYPELYRRVLNDPPKGCKPSSKPKRADVVRIY